MCFYYGKIDLQEIAIVDQVRIRFYATMLLSYYILLVCGTNQNGLSGDTATISQYTNVTGATRVVHSGSDPDTIIVLG